MSEFGYPPKFPSEEEQQKMKLAEAQVPDEPVIVDKAKGKKVKLYYQIS